LIRGQERLELTSANRSSASSKPTWLGTGGINMMQTDGNTDHRAFNGKVIRPPKKPPLKPPKPIYNRACRHRIAQESTLMSRIFPESQGFQGKRIFWALSFKWMKKF
jgi:hypothetical protein